MHWRGVLCRGSADSVLSFLPLARCRGARGFLLMLLPAPASKFREGSPNLNGKAGAEHETQLQRGGTRTSAVAFFFHFHMQRAPSLRVVVGHSLVQVPPHAPRHYGRRCQLLRQHGRLRWLDITLSADNNCARPGLGPNIALEMRPARRSHQSVDMLGKDSRTSTSHRRRTGVFAKTARRLSTASGGCQHISSPIGLLPW